MRTLGLGIAFFALTLAMKGASFRDDFAVVFIDAATEAQLGQFPLDRSILAKGIRQAANLGAKGVVLKLFLDQPKNEVGDLLLEQAMTTTPVLLQARMDDMEARPNSFPARFALPSLEAQAQVSGKSGWIPLTRFSDHAAGIGFVDFSTAVVPLLETYQSQTVKSLAVCCIELATGTQASIEPGKRLKFGAQELRVDERNCVTVRLPTEDNLKYIPFHLLVAGEIPSSQIKGKIVIIGYDGAQIQYLPTSIGAIRAHRFFVYALKSIYEQLGI